MKKIKSEELKEGDIVSTNRIFSTIKNGLLYSTNTIMRIEKIVIRSDGKKDIYVKSWMVTGDNIEIMESPLPSTIGELGLLEGKELSDFKRMLILNSLDENKRNSL